MHATEGLDKKPTIMNAMNMSKITVMALAMLMTVGSASSQPRRWRMRVRPAITIVSRPAVRVRVSNRFDKNDRLTMALAFIDNHGFITVKEYSKITRLSKASAQAELDAFATGRHNPLAVVVKGRKRVYIKA